LQLAVHVILRIQHHATVHLTCSEGDCDGGDDDDDDDDDNNDDNDDDDDNDDGGVVIIAVGVAFVVIIMVEAEVGGGCCNVITGVLGPAQARTDHLGLPLVSL
jgi:hypothetical protein